MTPVEFRRHLHAHPELSFEEHRTARFISEELTRLGIEHRPIARTGILARIEGHGTCGAPWCCAPTSTHCPSTSSARWRGGRSSRA